MAARRVGFLLALLLLGSSAAQAQQVQLRLTSQFPDTHHVGRGLVQFRDEVEQRTDKLLAIEVFDNARLYKDDQVLDAVSSGKIEMGLINGELLTDKVPAIAILQQPFLFNFYAIVEAATDPDREMRPLIDKAILEATGNRVLMWLPFGSSGILSKQQPTLSPSAISNKKIRVSGKTQAAFIEQCGGIPVFVPAGDQVAAVQDGRVDMLVTGITGVPARQLWKATDTMTRTEHAAIEALIVIRDAVWQRLSESHKAVMKEVGRRIERQLRGQIAQIEANDYDFAREKGMKIYALTLDEVAEWRECSAPVLDEFMTRSGGALAYRLMPVYGRLRTDPCCSEAPQSDLMRR
jgi:C4-dicarboxylate-binding protein DctP